MRNVKITDCGCIMAAAAHDFNNELTIILGSVTAAIQCVRPDNPAHAWLLEIRCAAKRSASKASTLLDFSVGSEVRPGAASMESLIESCEAAYLTAGVQ